MDEKAKNELLEKVKESSGEAATTAAQAVIDNFENDAMTPDQFKEQMDAIASENDIPGLKEKIEGIAIDIKKLREAGPKVVKSMRDMLVEKKETLDKLAKFDKSANLTMEFKTNVLRASVTDHTLAFRLGDVGQEAYRATVIANLFRQATIGPDNNGTIRYVDQETVTRNAAVRAEAATYPESAIVWQEYNLPIEKMTDSIPVSHEMLNDVDFVESELRRLMEVNMSLLEDTQVYSGSGVTPNLSGVTTTATAFTDTTPDLVDTNIYDLINILSNKIGNGFQSKYLANKVLMNPTDVLNMHSKKDTANNYVLPPFVSNDGMKVGNVEIIPTSTVTANTLLIGDFNWGTYYTSDAFEIEIGWVASQFIQDLMTIKARKRSALLVRTIDATAFYSVANITTALANLTA